MGHWITNTQFTCTVDCGYTTHTIPHSHCKSFLIVVVLNCNADLNRKFSFFRSHFFEVRPQWVSSHIESSSSKCRPPVDNWILSKCSKKCPNRVSPHFPLFCHTLQYELIKYSHFTHASWHWMMYSLSIFWNKKTHVLNCQTKIYLIWPNFSCKNFPSKVSIKFANKKKQSLSLLLVVCGQHCHF
jgi:hypothetical protein